jgi:excisionase family DNA binding protein
MKPLLKPEQAAALLAVSPKAVRAWLHDGTLPGVRVGRLWRIDPDALEAWIQGRADAKAAPQSAPLAPERRTPPPTPRATPEPPKAPEAPRTRTASGSDSERAEADRLRALGFKVASLERGKRLRPTPRKKARKRG